jgi:hypothetical protein
MVRLVRRFIGLTLRRARTDANPRTDGREPDANQSRELRELLERERVFGFPQIAVGRSEPQRRRTARLLREALRAMPKQLPAASPVQPDEGARIEAKARAKWQVGTYG